MVEERLQSEQARSDDLARVSATGKTTRRAAQGCDESKSLERAMEYIRSLLAADQKLK